MGNHHLDEVAIHVAARRESGVNRKVLVARRSPGGGDAHEAKEHRRAAQDQRPGAQLELTGRPVHFTTVAR